MDKNYFLKLLTKYLRGDVGVEEKRFVESYYNLFCKEPDIVKLLSNEDRLNLQHEVRENVFRSINNEEVSSTGMPSLYTRYRKVWMAAAFITLLMVAFAGYYISGSHQLMQANTLSPSSDTYTIANTDKQHLRNHVVSLPDGSSVVLSTGSRLHYNANFGKNRHRDVFLEGEAFFDVAHDSTSPFVVHTGNISTTVLGTAFDVRAVASEKNITVTVKRGKVKVSDTKKVLGVIIPEQQIVYNTEKVSSIKQNVVSNDYLQWKNDDLFIDNLKFEEAAKILEDQYHISIIVGDSTIKDQRFTTTFPANEQLDKVLKSISVFNGFQYSYNKDSTVVKIFK